MHRSLMARKNRNFAPCQAIALMFLLVLVSLCPGCSEDSVVVWQGSVKSPDGASVAVAKTTQYSGPGNAAVFTTVDIVRADGEGKPVEILVFEDPSESNPSAIRVDMSWKDTAHLDITYPKNAKLSFRADLYGKTMIMSHSSP